MEKVVLISDIDTDLGYSLLKQYYLHGYKIIGFSTTDTATLSLQDFNPEFIEITAWNRVSPIGVKNLIIRGIARFKTIDEALVLQTAAFANNKITTLPLLEIERNIDTWLKGNLYLVKELLDYALKHNKGILTLVNNIQYTEQTGSSPVADILDAGFKALAKNLFKFAKGSNVPINAVESDTSQHAKYAAFIYNIIEEKAAKNCGKTWFFHDKKFLRS